MPSARVPCRLKWSIAFGDCRKASQTSAGMTRAQKSGTMRLCSAALWGHCWFRKRPSTSLRIGCLCRCGCNIVSNSTPPTSSRTCSFINTARHDPSSGNESGNSTRLGQGSRSLVPMRLSQRCGSRHRPLPHRSPASPWYRSRHTKLSKPPLALQSQKLSRPTKHAAIALKKATRKIKYRQTCL